MIGLKAQTLKLGLRSIGEKNLFCYISLMELTSSVRQRFKELDRSFGGNISFFFKHYGKTKFMVAMSKRLQSHGMEALYEKNPKEFWWFFFLFLLRDSIIYIVVPIYIAKLTV